MSFIIQILVFGLQLGSIYALLALGYTMVYGIVNMINFAHGDFLMVGAYVAFFSANILFNIPYNTTEVLVVILIAIVASGTLGVITERVAYKPLRARPRLISLITSAGVSMFLQNLGRALPFVGPTPRSFPELIPTFEYGFFGVNITSVQIFSILFAALLMVFLQLLVTRTKTGTQMLAVSNDREASILMGINVNKIISITFFIGASLAAVSGILYSSVYPVIDVYMGSWLGTKAFIAAVLGGIGDIRGAMLGGILLGIIEVAGTTINSDFGYGILFVVMIIILLIKPAGLLGKDVIEKV